MLRPRVPPPTQLKPYPNPITIFNDAFLRHCQRAIGTGIIRGMSQPTVPQNAITKFHRLEASARALNMALRDVQQRSLDARQEATKHRLYLEQLRASRGQRLGQLPRGLPSGAKFVQPHDAMASSIAAVEAQVTCADERVKRLHEEYLAIETRWQTEAALVEACRKFLADRGALRRPGQVTAASGISAIHIEGAVG